jgi:hypothetical protein
VASGSSHRLLGDPRLRRALSLLRVPLEVNAHSTPIRLPEAVLAHVPIYDNIVPARFSFVVWLFAVIALTLGADRLIRTFMEHRSTGWVTTLGGAVVASARPRDRAHRAPTALSDRVRGVPERTPSRRST